MLFNNQKQQARLVEMKKEEDGEMRCFRCQAQIKCQDSQNDQIEDAREDILDALANQKCRECEKLMCKGCLRLCDACGKTICVFCIRTEYLQDES